MFNNQDKEVQTDGSSNEGNGEENKQHTGSSGKTVEYESCYTVSNEVYFSFTSIVAGQS